MAVHVYIFLLMGCLLFFLARLGRLDWLHLQPPHSREEAKRSTLHRLRHRRAAQTIAPPVVSPPLPRGVESWRLLLCVPGARSKAGGEHAIRVNTEGYACPNQKCLYFCITDALIHALVGDGKHGHAERIQTFRCQACHTTFSARHNTPLYRLKTPSHQVAMVLAALAEGLDPSAAERVFGFRQATITTWLTRAGNHARTLHERFFCHLHLPHLQLDELRTRLRCSTQVLWLWLVIDPCTKILPVLSLGPRTQHMAHKVIHSLRQILAPSCLPLFTSAGLHLYFYALTAHFGQWRAERCRGRNVRRWQVATNLIYGQVKNVTGVASWFG